MKVAELDRWALEREWGAQRRAGLETYVGSYVVYPSSRDLGRAWAAATFSARRNGHPISSEDVWQAATALINGVPLVTHDRRHFVGVDHLDLISKAGS